VGALVFSDKLNAWAFSSVSLLVLEQPIMIRRRGTPDVTQASARTPNGQYDFRDYNEWVRTSGKADCQLLTAESLRQCLVAAYARCERGCQERKTGSPPSGR